MIPTSRRRSAVLIGLLVVGAQLLLPLAGCSLLNGVDLGVPGVQARYLDVPTPEGKRSVLVAQSDQLAAQSQPDPVPLVVVLHGYQSDAEVMAKITSMAAEAGEKNFVGAFGVGLNKSWNAGPCCGMSATAGIDDVAYVRAAILTVEKSYPVDRSKVYLLGYSNGAMLAYKVLCDAPELVSSVVSVAGTNTTGCHATQPRPFLQMSGDDDPIVPIGGSTKETAPGVGPTPPVLTSVAGIAQDFGCPKSKKTSLGPVIENRWEPCRNGVPVVFDIVHAAGHGWPTGEPFSTTTRILQFWGLA